MRWLPLLALLLLPHAAPAQEKVVLRGAGATFPAPLYKKWIAEYAKREPATRIDYQDVGSGEGARRFLANAVDFGASDAALSDEQIARAKPGVKLVPATAGMVVLAYNLPGLKAPLKLSRAVYAGILEGRITKWDDARLQAANPGVKLPERTIGLAVRLDSSGTTFALTNHLGAVSEPWRKRGAGTLTGWPATAMLARGNEGVAGLVKNHPGAIGYVEYSFAKRLGLAMAELENRAGRYVAPSDASGRAALANLKDVPPNLRIFIPDPDGADSYPMVSLSWLLLYERYADAAKGDALKRFVGWALTDGQAYGGDLGYFALPAELAERSRAAARSVQ